MCNRDQLFKSEKLEAHLPLTHPRRQKRKRLSVTSSFRVQLAKEFTFTFESIESAQDDNFSSFLKCTQGCQPTTSFLAVLLIKPKRLGQELKCLKTEKTLIPIRKRETRVSRKSDVCHFFNINELHAAQSVLYARQL